MINDGMEWKGFHFLFSIPHGFQLSCGQDRKKRDQTFETHPSVLTPLKINMEPKNGGLEDDFPFRLGDF